MAKINFKKYSKKKLDDFITREMQKEPDKRHPQTFEAITEQGLRDPKTKQVFKGVNKLFKDFGFDISKF